MGELFDVLSSKKIFNANKIDNIYNKQIKNTYPYIVRKTIDNGLKGYIKENEKYLNDGNTLSFAQDTFTVYYQKEKFFTGNRVKILKPKFSNVKHNVMIILTTLIQKQLEKLSWGDSSTIESINKTNFYLPTKNGKIDFEFMENFVTELEAQRVTELEAYLTVTNLKDYQLTTEEEKTLDNFTHFEWKEYRIGDLFESENGNFDIQKKHINNKGINVITAGLNSNGILGKSDVNAKIFKEKTITIDMFGNCFYRNFKYKMVTHARVFSLIPKIKITDKIGIFLANSLTYLSNKFGYENMCSFVKIKDKKIKLPIKNGKIDFEYMETFISAIQKLVIKDVVEWTDKKIKLTKQVIN
ncbi:restriction endonuclease subunit S [Mycoplasma sp. 1018B]|uniref:restriction endonuclease subunit S n=1 Tax=Mycoplasma sp. 1018B TaxID=2967302 RepID=UPI00211D13B4|nr:restriction endonuclease subunit S [Mycoplasma sp. 1018B]UUM19490.1 restriction endonuclease subunit S [Mycoplasma sp. 1018B]